MYALADLFVYPSFYEGFGFPPLEALAQGTPVVTSWLSSLPEVVGEWAFLVNPMEVGEIALVMEELLRRPCRVPPQVSAAVQERFTWDKAAVGTLQILERVYENCH
jgi:glycosyltransferase involved in cell wall biosynthesis